MTISFTDGLSHIDDQLSVRNQGSGAGQIGYDTGTGQVSYAGVVFGTAVGGDNGNDLVITLNANAHVAEVKALIQNITFANTDTSNPVVGTRTINYHLNDGGGTALGGLNTVSGNAFVSVTRANDAPILTVTAPDLGTYSEDIADPYITTTIADLLFNSIAVESNVLDVDDGAVEGVAITGLNSGNGTWQYNTGSGWVAIGTVSNTSALLLRDTDSIRFVPDGENADTASVTFKAWDRTSGTFGTKSRYISGSCCGTCRYIAIFRA
ncbi:hypothetical protein [Methylocucumis oryzae]|uniref:Uncharacterized protein n=1 Tax=Methylocucumis oryzae TaxID=1632867 RepID=A0A0F3IGS5_9GAMM|nr:hypothetical protein [Methylocucumis oryzae]KJV05961.1 hypothetical protein VZ94_14495 [Methylocucumis oryzae]